MKSFLDAMRILQEVTAPTLVNNAEKGFPYTRKRQHSIDMVEVVDLNWTPLVGVKTLRVVGEVKGEGFRNPEFKKTTYKTIIFFKDVKFEESKKGKNIVELKPSSGDNVFLEKIDLRSADIKVRCSCPDFRHRFEHFNKRDKALYGNPRSYTRKTDNYPPVNPKKVNGVCKHLMKMFRGIIDSGVAKT